MEIPVSFHLKGKYAPSDSMSFEVYNYSDRVLVYSGKDYDTTITLSLEPLKIYRVSFSRSGYDPRYCKFLYGRQVLGKYSTSPLILPMGDDLSISTDWQVWWIEDPHEYYYFAIYPGATINNLSNVFVGSTEYSKIYVGDSQIYGKPYSISTTTINAHASGDNPTIVRVGKSATLNFTFDGDYECPTTSPIVTNATGVWIKNSATSGTMVLSNPTGDVSITVIGEEVHNS